MNFLRLTPILLLLLSLGTDLWAASPGDYRGRSSGTWRQQNAEKKHVEVLVAGLAGLADC